MRQFFCIALLWLTLLGANIDNSTANYIDMTPDKILISASKQAKLKQQYLQQYFSPWADASQNISSDEIKNLINAELQVFLAEPGFGENQQPHQQNWVKHLANYANLDHINHHYQKAITTRPTDVRRLPTNKPSFKSFQEAGQGYPFDLVQNSLLAANTPILVLHRSQDRAWSYIQCHFIKGWIQSTDLAEVDQSFIKHWQTKRFVSPTHRQVAVNDNRTDRFLFYARIGSILPLVKKNKTNYLIQVAVSDANQHAVIKSASISNKESQLWPLNASTENFVLLSDQLLNEPYGWGGLYQDRDCSATIMDLFAEFGLWLPRASKDQAHAGNFISLAGMSRQAKQDKLRQYGHSLTTLINLDGHVLLYLGEQHGLFYVLHSIWGLHTIDHNGVEGRDIIGKTVITTLTQGDNRKDITKTYLDRVYGITLLN